RYRLYFSDICIQISDIFHKYFIQNLITLCMNEVPNKKQILLMEVFKMTRLTRWNPLREMVDMQRQLDRVFDEMNGNLSQGDWTQTGNWLAFDIHENEDNYIVETDLPGIDPDNIDVT